MAFVDWDLYDACRHGSGLTLRAGGALVSIWRHVPTMIFHTENSGEVETLLTHDIENDIGRGPGGSEPY